MNISSLLGMILAFGVFVGAILTSTNASKVFFNGHALLIVGGGTLAAAMISFPISHLFDALKILFRRVLGQATILPQDLIKEFVRLADGYKNDTQFLAKNVTASSYPFLREALELIVEGGVPFEEMENILDKRAEIIFLENEEEAHTFKSISKFPPAFGLLGAVMGMISLMQGLGSPDSFKQIGPSMAMAMVATLYGIALANFVFIPVGENLSKLNKKELLNRNIVIDGIRLLQQKKHPLIVEESLKSYLRPKDRQKASGKVFGGPQGKAQTTSPNNSKTNTDGKTPAA